MNFIKSGVVSLHNSWTPKEIKSIKNIEDFLNKKMPIVALLEYALSNEVKPVLYDSLIFVEAYIVNELKNRSISYKKRYYNGMLVLDFQINNFNFAFDICDVGYLESYLIIRDTKNIERYTKIEGLVFESNKSKLNNVANKRELLERIVQIYYYYSIANSI